MYRPIKVFSYLIIGILAAVLLKILDGRKLMMVGGFLGAVGYIGAGTSQTVLQLGLWLTLSSNYMARYTSVARLVSRTSRAQQHLSCKSSAGSWSHCVSRYVNLLTFKAPVAYFLTIYLIFCMSIFLFVLLFWPMPILTQWLLFHSILWSKSLYFIASLLWNDLPLHICQADSLQIFKGLLKTHLFKSIFL